jgi:hypothetical protein
MNAKKTDDIFLETEAPPTIPRPEQEATHFVDVHIYRLGDDDENETRTIEATLEAISKANQPPDDDAQPTQPRPGRKLSPFISLIVGIVLLALLGKGYQLYLLPLMTPTTTITIVPTSKQVQIIQSIQIVTGTPQAGRIAGRELSSITLSQTQTVATTGTAHQEATAAQGTITFYNAASTVQTIATGTMITGANGIQIVTDQDAIIPAAVYPTFGQATVPAHTVLIGAVANSKAGTIYGPCCRLNISAVSSAFTGGQDGRDYRTVSTQDITSTATNIKGSLTASTRAALQTQLHPGETMLEPVCTAQVTSDHSAGNEATQVSVTVEQSCTTIAYPTIAVQTAMSQAVTHVAQRQLGTGYIQVGDVGVTLKGQHQSTTEATVQLQAQGTWYRQWSDTRLSTLTHQLAGKSKQEATRLLLHTPGIAQVEGLPDTLPTDPASIQVLILLPTQEKGL